VGFFDRVADILFRERRDTSIVVTLPTALVKAVDTLVYMRNGLSEDSSRVDRDDIIGLALSEYLQKHLVDRNEAKIKAMPAPSYTSGRRQARSASAYADYQTYYRQQQ
jgi:hypothetical protein